MKIEKGILFFPLALVLYEIATYLSNDMYLPSLPALTQEFNISQDQAQYTLLSWFLGSASMQLIVGPLSDRFGRKIILLLGGSLYILATFLNGVTDNINTFLVMRFIQGTTVSSMVVAGYAAVHELYDSKTAIKIITLMGSITILAPAFGPLLGACILERYDWRVIFYVLSFLALISVLILSKVMPDTNPHRLHLNLTEILKDYALIASRASFLRFTLPFCFLFLSLICWIIQSPFIIIETYGRSTMEYGFIQLLVFGNFILGAQITRILLNRLEPPKIINMGMCVAMIGALFTLIISLFMSSHLYLIVLMIMVYALGTAMTLGPLNRYAIETCQEPMGRRVAIFSTIMAMFGVFGTIFVTIFEGQSMENLSIIIIAGVGVAVGIFRLWKQG